MQILFNENGHPTGVAEGIDVYQYAADIGGSIVEMNGDQPSIDHEAYPDGEWRVPQETLIAQEIEWRDMEMPAARDNVTAIDFGDESIPGTSDQWRAYWIALRAWKGGNPDFPDQTKRPIKPTGE